MVFGVVGKQGVFTALWDQAWELPPHESTTSSPWKMGMSKEPPSVLPLGILLMAPDLSMCLCFLHSHPRPNFEPPGMGWPRAPVQVRSSSCRCCPVPGSLWPHWDELRAVKSCSLQRLIFGIGHISVHWNSLHPQVLLSGRSRRDFAGIWALCCSEMTPSAS